MVSINKPPTNPILNKDSDVIKLFAVAAASSKTKSFAFTEWANVPRIRTISPIMPADLAVFLGDFIKLLVDGCTYNDTDAELLRSRRSSLVHCFKITDIQSKDM
jgi:hypothetical protein